MHRLAGLLALILLAVACSGGSPAPSTAQANDARTFAALIQGAAHYDYEPSESPADLRAAVDLVVVGTVEEIVTGRIMPYGRNQVQLNLVVRVIEVTAGSLAPAADGRVYVELTMGSAQRIEDFQSERPTGRVVFFLGDRTHIQGAQGETGRPGGQPVYAPAVEGMLIESTSGLVSAQVPMEEMAPAWRQLASFDELLAAIRR